MFIGKAPLRVSFNGGGSDLPAHYTKFGGAALTATIDRFVYVTVNPSFSKAYRIAYSKIEYPEDINYIQHPLIKNSLKVLGVEHPLEITTLADVPSNGSGLGSSSSFTVALLNALSLMQGVHLSSYEVAKMACKIEIEMTQAPIGVQDQYAASFGGLNFFSFQKSGNVTREPVAKTINEQEEIISFLNLHALFFHIDYPRDANLILRRQNDKLKNESKNHEKTSELKDLAMATKLDLIDHKIESFGRKITQGWMIKCELNGDSKDSKIMSLVSRVKANDEIFGAKLLGAGGGGFLMVFCHPERRENVIKLFSEYRKVDFQFKNSISEAVRI